jgi:hypothetical protein
VQPGAAAGFMRLTRAGADRTRAFCALISGWGPPPRSERGRRAMAAMRIDQRSIKRRKGRRTPRHLR